jgi:photosystem II stability/assembly factor-like uncharacterized protein
MTPYTGQLYPTAFPQELGILNTFSFTTESVPIAGTLEFEIPSTKTYQIVSITSSAPCWLRVYGSSYGRSTDTRNNPGAPFPAPGSGFFAEIQTTVGNPTFSLSPAVSVQVETTQTYFSIRNEGEYIEPIRLTFEVVPTSYSLAPSAPPYGCNINVNTQWQTDLSNAWRNCASFTRLPLLDLSSATSLQSAWRDCSNLSYVPPKIFDNCLATDLSYAFINCSLTSPSVDNILVSLDVAGQSNGTVDITGGSNLAPSVAGLIALANLEARGWTVNVEAGSLPTSVDLGSAIFSVASFGDGRVFAGDEFGNIYKSIDGGVTFDGGTPVGNGEIRSMAACDGDTIIAGTWDDTFLWVSTDGGDSWAAGEDFSDNEIDYVAYAGSGIVYVGTQRYIFKSLDNGVTWSVPVEPKPGGNGYYLCMAFPGPNEIVAGTFDDGYIVYSSDGGDTWSYTSNSVLNGLRYIFGLASNGAGIVIAGTRDDGRVFRSDDSGATWDAGTQLGAATGMLNSLTCSEDGTFYAGTNDNAKIFRSTDDGLTWEEFFSPSTTGQVLCLSTGGLSNLIAGIESFFYNIPYDVGNEPVNPGGSQIYPDLANNVQSLPYAVLGESPITNIVSLTQADYDALPAPSPTTLYVIVGQYE